MKLTVFTEPQQGASYEQLLTVARTAEQEGFDGFFRSDHFLRMGSGSGEPGPTDAWLTLAGLARETSRIRLGTLVSSATFRLPGLLAVAVAQVDAMSGGRVELGLGTGWFEGEHAAYGIPFPPLADRFEMLEEQLEVITGMWTMAAGQLYSHKGPTYSIVDSPALPKPAQRPHPPIIVGGAGHRRTPRLAVAYATEFNVPFHPLEATIRQFERARSACADAGRDPATLVLSVAQTICCGVDEKEVRRRAEAIGRPIENIDLPGTPEQVAERLAGFAAAGATRVHFQILDLDDLDHLRLIAAELAPLLPR